jgi:hypothetical protein
VGGDSFGWAFYLEALPEKDCAFGNTYNSAYGNPYGSRVKPAMT